MFFGGRLWRTFLDGRFLVDGHFLADVFGRLSFDGRSSGGRFLVDVSLADVRLADVFSVDVSLTDVFWRTFFGGR